MARDMRYADWSSQGQVPLSECRRWLQSCVTHMNWEWGVMTSLGIFSWDWCPLQSIKPSILDSSPVFLRLQYCNSAPGTMHSIPETIWPSFARMWLKYSIALFPNRVRGVGLQPYWGGIPVAELTGSDNFIVMKISKQSISIFYSVF